MKLFFAAILLMASQSAVISEAQEPTNTLCIMAGIPLLGSDFSTINSYRVGRNFYGKTEKMEAWVVKHVDSLGANAVINHLVSQDFGFWPWQVVRPVATGTAIIWHNKTDGACKSLGGQVFQISRRAVTNITESIDENAISTVKALPEPPKEVQSEDFYDRLTKLDELRKKGIITDDEFEAKKKEILSGL